ncbi:MAG: hypothetical protein ABIM83_07980, partial [candidate division WOR-3 bacterium]
YYYECIVVENKGSVFREEGFLSEIRTIGPAGEIFFKEKIKPKEEVPEEKKEKIIIEEKEKETPEEKAPEGGGK